MQDFEPSQMPNYVDKAVDEVDIQYITWCKSDLDDGFQCSMEECDVCNNPIYLPFITSSNEVIITPKAISGQDIMAMMEHKWEHTESQARWVADWCAENMNFNK